MKFADTSWWAAWSLPNDDRHAAALTLTKRLAAGEQLLTTSLVVGETWTLLLRRDSHRTAVAFFDRIDSLMELRRLTVHQVTVEQDVAARSWLRRHDERTYSWVDATSFQVMRDRRLREAFAFDNDFTAAGFVEVRP